MKSFNLIAFLLVPLALPQAVSASDMRKTSTGKAETAAIVSAATDYVKKNSGRNMEFRITIEDTSGDFARARVDPLKKETDALVYLKRTRGKWEGLIIGTSFSEFRSQKACCSQEPLAMEPWLDRAGAEQIVNFIRHGVRLFRA